MSVVNTTCTNTSGKVAVQLHKLLEQAHWLQAQSDSSWNFDLFSWLPIGLGWWVRSVLICSVIWFWVVLFEVLGCRQSCLCENTKPDRLMLAQCFEMISNSCTLDKVSLPWPSMFTHYKKLLKCGLLAATNSKSFSHPEGSCPTVAWRQNGWSPCRRNPWQYIESSAPPIGTWSKCRTKLKGSQQSHTGNLTWPYRALQLFSKQQQDTSQSPSTKSVHATSGLFVAWPSFPIQICILVLPLVQIKPMKATCLFLPPRD